MYKDKKIFILGMARSGYEVAKLLAPDNKILITDVKPQDNDKVKELEGIGVEFILSDKPDDFFDDSYDIDVFKLSSMHRLFFSTPFNDHLGGSGSPNKYMIKEACRNSGVSINNNLIDKNSGVYEYLRQIAASENLEYEPEKIFSSYNGVIFDSLNSMIAAGIATFKNR